MTLDTHQIGWNTAGSFKIIMPERMLVFKFPTYYDRIIWKYSNFVFKTVKIIHC